MPKRLTQAQVDEYHRDGFCFPVDVMSRNDAQAFRERLEEVECRYPDAVNAHNRNNSHITFTCLDDIVHHSAILDAVEDLIGPNFLVWGSVLFIKEPDARGFVSWHQDMTYIPMEPHDGVTAWLALSPSNCENGCMKMVPGSHRTGIQTHHDRFGEDNILTRGQTIEGIDQVSTVDLILEPGQISLHHGHTIHGSSPNRSNDRRIGIAIQQYVPTHARETKVKGFVQLVRGRDDYGHFEIIPRPKVDMSPEAVAVRDKVNAHWADLLYDGAAERRAF